MASEFEKWCPITITNEATAPKSAALVRAYRTAFAAGERSFRERAARECEGMHCSANDGYGLTCHRDDAKAIRLMKTEGEK
jgi:hypothetical protein